MNLIRLYVNGTQVEARQPEEGEGPGFKPGPPPSQCRLPRQRPDPRRRRRSDGRDPAEVAIDNQSKGTLDKRGTLRIVAIGMDRYSGLGMACRELDGVTPKSCDATSASPTPRLAKAWPRSSGRSIRRL